MRWPPRPCSPRSILWSMTGRRSPAGRRAGRNRAVFAATDSLRAGPGAAEEGPLDLDVLGCGEFLLDEFSGPRIGSRIPLRILPVVKANSGVAEADGQFLRPRPSRPRGEKCGKRRGDTQFHGLLPVLARSGCLRRRLGCLDMGHAAAAVDTDRNVTVNGGAAHVDPVLVAVVVDGVMLGRAIREE